MICLCIVQRLREQARIRTHRFPWLIICASGAVMLLGLKAACGSCPDPFALWKNLEGAAWYHRCECCREVQFFFLIFQNSLSEHERLGMVPSLYASLYNHPWLGHKLGDREWKRDLCWAAGHREFSENCATSISPPLIIFYLYETVWAAEEGRLDLVHQILWNYPVGKDGCPWRMDLPAPPLQTRNP